MESNPPPPASDSAPNPDDPPIIEVENLKAGYEDRVILEGISFSVRRGEIFVILGGSGCGKSTLLKHMIGLHRPTEGDVRIGGKSMLAAEGRDKRRLLRKIGVAYQSGALFGSMSVLENVRLPLEEFADLPEAAMNLICLMKLDLVGLRKFADFAPSDLSGGMRKRAAIARALALDPDVVFLDEPSAGLDPVTSVELDDMIVRFSRILGVTFVVVTHELASIFRIADRVIMLDRKTRGIIAEGKPEDLRRESPDPAVRRFFNREPEPSEPSADEPPPGPETDRGAGPEIAAAGLGLETHPGGEIQGRPALGGRISGPDARRAGKPQSGQNEPPEKKQP